LFEGTIEQTNFGFGKARAFHDLVERSWLLEMLGEQISLSICKDMDERETTNDVPILITFGQTRSFTESPHFLPLRKRSNIRTHLDLDRLVLMSIGAMFISAVDPTNDNDLWIDFPDRMTHVYVPDD
jgi:EAL domain-containing protein (putative c-di-GMP-specific phosphodiesterase class I)